MNKRRRALSCVPADLFQPRLANFRVLAFLYFSVWGLALSMAVYLCVVESAGCIPDTVRTIPLMSGGTISITLLEMDGPSRLVLQYRSEIPDGSYRGAEVIDLLEALDDGTIPQSVREVELRILDRGVRFIGLNSFVPPVVCCSETTIWVDRNADGGWGR